MKKLLLICSVLVGLVVLASAFCLRNFSALASQNGSQPIPEDLKITGSNIVRSPIDSYYAENQVRGNTKTSIGKADSRPVIINNFLARHNSPMRGLGDVFVSTADRYGLDFRLIPAIAFQESTLGRNMPKGSHNAFGWAIYTGANSGAIFHNWQFAIETVAKGLKTDYIDRGLTTPEQIMTRYSDSGGSWAFGVNFAISEMTPR